MVERLKAEPFALLGINSDGDRDVSDKLSEEEKTAIRAAGSSQDATLDSIRAGTPAVLAKLGAQGEPLRKKILEADRQNLRKILDKNKITWRQSVEGSTGGALPSHWNVQSWPTIYIIDAQGVIRFKDLRGEEMEEAVGRLLQEAKAGGGR
jgi:hypothetical protein